MGGIPDPNGGVNADGYFVPVPICDSFGSCIDPTGLLFGGRPREDATRQVVAKSARSPHLAYRRWGLCVANLLFRNNLVISSNDPREGACASEFVKAMEGSVVPIPFAQAHGIMVQSYSRYAQDPSTPVPLRLQNPAGDYPPPQPLDHIYHLATQVLDAAQQVKLVLEIGQCILEAVEWPIAVECITALTVKYVGQRLVVSAIKWVVKWIADHRFSADSWARLQQRIEKWLEHRAKNEDPPMPQGFDPAQGGTPMGGIPLPLDVPTPLTAGQDCNWCGRGQENEEMIDGDLVHEHSPSDNSQQWPRSVLQGPGSEWLDPQRGAPNRSYGQAGQMLRLPDRFFNEQKAPRPVGIQAGNQSAVMPY